MKELGIDIKGATASIQGAGNVAQYAVDLFEQYGGKTIAISCWDNNDKKAYTYRCKDGIAFDKLMASIDKFGTIDPKKAKANGWEQLDADAWIEQEVDRPHPRRPGEHGHRRERGQDQAQREDHRRGRQRPHDPRGRQGHPRSAASS